MKLFFRRFYRSLAFAGWMFCALVYGLPAFLMKREKGMKRNLNFEMTWGKGILKILNAELTMEGTVPRNGGFLIVSNHTSYMDAAVHASAFPIRFAPKKELKSWPLLGQVASMAFPIWVDRSRKSGTAEILDEYEKTLDMGFPLLVYPEGTFTKKSELLSRFKSTAFEAVIRNRKPILPIITSYTVVQDDGVQLPATDGFPEMMRYLLGARSIRIRIRVLDPILPASDDRKEVAQIVHDAMERAMKEQNNS